MLKKKVDAPFNCDSVEVNMDKSLAFVGMYQYDDSSNSRGGGIIMMDSDANIVSTTETTYGCLDAKWTDNQNISIACSDGVLRNFSTMNSNITNELEITQTGDSGDTAAILMTVDKSQDLTCTISAKGTLSLVRDWNIVSSWEAHSPVYESWCCGLSPSASVVVTGSDDCSLKFWDPNSSSLVYSNNRSHRMGTTCVEFLSETELLSGSYDDTIRKFDMRNLSEPVSEFKSIGGIWRMVPDSGNLYIAACYGGCQVVSLDTFAHIVEEYTGHDSMAYGIGYLGNSSVLSCSFYDRSIQLWTY